MRKLLNKISSDKLLHEAAELLQAAFSSNNMAVKYNLFHEANDLKKIAGILSKYEEMQFRGDLWHRTSQKIFLTEQINVKNVKNANFY